MTIEPVTGTLTVGQLAARAGVRADTIRYYERAVLLPEPSRTDGDHRRYGPADLDRMLFIRGAQRLGRSAPRRQGGTPSASPPTAGGDQMPVSNAAASSPRGLPRRR
jgi:hypothetical protein